MSLESIENKYLEMTDNDIDNLLLGVNLDDIVSNQVSEDTNKCSSCMSDNIVTNQNMFSNKVKMLSSEWVHRFVC